MMKYRVLQLLRQQAEYLSGADLSDLLGVSRTAVWKHINSLRADGYGIASKIRTGYLLEQLPDRLYPVEIQYELPNILIGKKIAYYPQVNSTNETARQLAAQMEPEGTVVIAECQLAGRGRLGRPWVSPATKGIWMSVILRPRVNPTQLPWLTLLAAVAIVKAVRRTTGILAGIKWPNDILVNGLKVAGILSEMTAEPELMQSVIVGIGLNANLTSVDFPEELQSRATSLAQVLGKDTNRIALTQAVLQEFEQLYLQVWPNWALIREEWIKYNVTLNQRVTFQGSGGQVIEGLAKEISNSGALIVIDAAGAEHTVVAGDVNLKGQGSEIRNKE